MRCVAAEQHEESARALCWRALQRTVTARCGCTREGSSLRPASFKKQKRTVHVECARHAEEACMPSSSRGRSRLGPEGTWMSSSPPPLRVGAGPAGAFFLPCVVAIYRNTTSRPNMTRYKEMQHRRLRRHAERREGFIFCAPCRCANHPGELASLEMQEMSAHCHPN